MDKKDLRYFRQVYEDKSINQATFEWDEFENKETLHQLKNGTLDATFMIGTTMQDGFVCETVYQGNMTALVYPEHPYYNSNEISIKDLEHQKLISLNKKKRLSQ